MGTLTLSRTIQAAAPSLFQTLSSDFSLLEWFCADARLACRPEGRVYFWWPDGYAVTGHFTALEPPQRLAFTWQGSDEPGVSQVTMTLIPDADATTLTLMHETPAGAAWDAARQRHAALWNAALDNLQSVTEKGVDLRTARRAVVGITGGATMDAAAAAELGVPVSAGFRLTGIAPGTGAAEAGLQADDVIVAIGTHEVSDGPTLQQATGRFSSGDTTTITIYRAAAKMTLPLTLGGQLQAPAPATPAAFAAALENIYGALMEELDALFDGYSEEEAGMRPARTEWSAKEVLAHLILTERWGHEYVTLAVARINGGGFANDLGVHAAVARTYSTVPALLQELGRAFQVTALSVGALPQGFFTERRATLNAFANTFLLALPMHTHTHGNQIRAALLAARAGEATTA